MARLLLTCALLVITVSVSRVYANDLPSPFLEAVKRLKLNKKISYIPDRITQLKNIEDDLPGRLRKRQSYACSKAYREAQSPRVEQCLPYLADEGRYTSNTQVAAFCRLECDTILKQVFTDLYACEGSSSVRILCIAHVIKSDMYQVPFSLSALSVRHWRVNSVQGPGFL